LSYWGIKPRALHMLGKQSTTKLHPWALGFFINITNNYKKTTQKHTFVNFSKCYFKIST
jgi:uncharacterized membrane protein YfbV (UPF0208 family)